MNDMNRTYFQIGGFSRITPISIRSPIYTGLPQPVETVLLPNGIKNLYMSLGAVYYCVFTPYRDEHGDYIYDGDGNLLGEYENTAVTADRISATVHFFDYSGNEINSVNIHSQENIIFDLDMTSSARLNARYFYIEISSYYRELLLSSLPTGNTQIDTGKNLYYAVPAPQFSGYYEFENWSMDEDGNLYNENSPEIREKAVVIPMPKALWRINPLMNGGFAWHELLPDIMGIDIEPLPIERKIKVYSMWEPQDGFKHNGLAILDPISCISHEEENSRYDVTLVHPLDDWGKWKYLIPQNILKVNGQLFRIDIQQPKINSSERTVTVTANHIFYDLSRDIILLKQISEPENQNWYPALTLNWIMQNGVIASDRAEHPAYYSQFNIYDFTYSTDISSDKKNQFDGFTNTTLTAALIGESNCFVNLFGGELYRNNFYFSINQRRENARDNAFSFRYSFDLTEIEFSVDYTNFMTRLDFIDMYGNWSHTILWGESAFEQSTPSPIARAIKFNSPLNDEIRENYFQSVAYPKYTYKINLAQIKDDPKYRDFQNLHDVKVGDKGLIFCEPLGVKTEQKVIALDRDELSLEILSVTLGDSTKSLARSNPYQGITTSGNSPTDLQSQALQEEIRKTNLKNIKHWNGASSYSWGEISTFKWGEIYE